MNTAIIILAGGSSTRMSSPKQLLKFNGRSLIRGAGQIAQSLKPKRIITVTGFLNNEIQNELQDFVIEYIHNENHRRGMSSSIVCGIKAIKSDVKIDEALIMLCDQPLIPIEHYKKLIEIAHKGKAEIVASAYNNTFGAPALFKRCHFSDLMALDSLTGAKTIINNNKEKVEFVQCDNAQFDIDTDLDFQKIIDKI